MKKGFTLIELLIVIVIIGILAAIAIPSFSRTREDAYMSTMKTDLKSVAENAEIAFRDNGTYAKYVPPTGMGEVSISFRGMSDGWYAEARYAGTKLTCFMASGSGVIEGMPADKPVCGEVNHEKSKYD